ncbi:MAG TPA: alanine--glyoxylate aminotransferase family protein [Limnobacter sp.]|nr:alanine--glyoxylate aminotransferase family protein [Limnobacter sp.]
MNVPAPTHLHPLQTLLPNEPLLMMGAGPVPIPHRVAQANSIVINHLGVVMAQVIDQVKSMGAYVFQTQSKHVLGVAGPGSAAMEMAIANLVEPGDGVLAVCNGYFSRRMADMAERVGGVVKMVDVPNNQAATPEHVESYLRTGRYKVLTIVQGETSNTVHNPQLQDISRLAHSMGCAVVVDAVCTLSTMPFEMDDWQVDAVITGGQKGLSSIPGVSLLAFSEFAWQRITQRKAPRAHWCLDAMLADQFWNKRAYHYTAPVSGILALHEALHLVCEETLEHRFRRHELCSKALQHGIEAMGLSLLVPEPVRLNSVIGVQVPEGVSSEKVRAYMSAVHRVEISGSFGLNIVRIGQMGEQSRAHNLFRTLHALGSSMKHEGAKLDLPAGLSALESCLSKETHATYVN